MMIAAVSLVVWMVVLLGADVARAEEAPSVEMFTINNLWIMIASAMVFLMHLWRSAFASTRL